MFDLPPNKNPKSIQIVIKPGDNITEKMSVIDKKYHAEFRDMLAKILLPQADLNKSFLENFQAKQRPLGDVNDTGLIVWAYVAPDGKMEAFYGPERPMSGGRPLKNNSNK
jgi:hypothetical protein